MQSTAASIERRENLFLRLEEFHAESGILSRRQLQLKQDPFRNELEPRLRLLVGPDSVLVSPELTLGPDAVLDLAVGIDIHDGMLPKEGQATEPLAGTAEPVCDEFQVEFRSSESGTTPSLAVVLLGRRQLTLVPDSAHTRVRESWSIDLKSCGGGRGRLAFSTRRVAAGPKDLFILPSWWSPVLISPGAAPAPAARIASFLQHDLVHEFQRATVFALDAAHTRFPPPLPDVELGAHQLLDATGVPRMKDGVPELKELVRKLVSIEAHFDPGPGLYVEKGGARPALAFAGDAGLEYAAPDSGWPDGAVLRLACGFHAWHLPLPVGSAELSIFLGEQRIWQRSFVQSEQPLANGWSEGLSVRLPDGPEARNLPLRLIVHVPPFGEVQSAQLHHAQTGRVLPATLVRPWFGIARPRIETDRAVPVRRREESAIRPQNVVFVCIETLRRDALGWYGRKPSPSPRLDQRVAAALKFRDPVSPQPWTSPSVASYLSGLPPHRHGVVSEDQDQLCDWVVTLAEAAAAEGVATGAFVTNELLRPETGFAAGFDTYCMAYAANALQLNTAFLDWTSTLGERSFFAYLHYFEPHAPLNAPGEFREAFVAEELRALPYFDTEGKVKSALRHGDVGGETAALEFLRGRYLGEIAFLDQQLDALLGELERRGLARDTLVILTSDHGEEFGEQRWYGHGSRLPGVAYQVPLALFGAVRPGWVESGVSVHAVTTQSIVSALGLQAQAERLGIVPLDFPLHSEQFENADCLKVATEKGIDLRTPPGPEFEKRMVEAFTKRPLRALHVGTDKYVFQWTRLPRGARSVKALEAELEEIVHFDLSRDPTERSPHHPDLRDLPKAVVDALLQQLRAEEDFEPLPTSGVSPEAQAVLENLGYIEKLPDRQPP